MPLRALCVCLVMMVLNSAAWAAEQTCAQKDLSALTADSLRVGIWDKDQFSGKNPSVGFPKTMQSVTDPAQIQSLLDLLGSIEGNWKKADGLVGPFVVAFQKDGEYAKTLGVDEGKVSGFVCGGMKQHSISDEQFDAIIVYLGIKRSGEHFKFN